MKIFSEKNKFEQPMIKKGVDFIFQRYPQLASIGTKEQYSQYLDSIFPQSPYKEIVYHSSENEFEDFNNEMIGKNTDSKFLEYYGRRIHFTTEPSSGYGKFVIAAVINPSEDQGEYPTDNAYVNPRVENAEQIQILGSEKDINGFKKFINSL